MIIKGIRTLEERSGSSLVALIRTRTFSPLKLWLFFLGIILVSTLGSASASFLSGISQHNFYLGERSDVLVITQPGSTTPLTSSVHEYLVPNLQNIEGIELVSPETLSIGLIRNYDNAPVTLHGITNEFQLMDDITLLSGNWLFPSENDSLDEFNTSDIGVVAGVDIANKLGLTVGQNMLISSTLTDISLNLALIGIIETGTPVDEELIVSLNTGRIFSLIPLDSITLIRVLFNPSLTSKSVIQGIISNSFSLNVKIIYPSYDDFVLEKTSLSIFSYSDELLYSSTEFVGNQTTFELPFGAYKLYLENPDLEAVRTEIFLDRDYSVDDPLILHFPKSKFTIDVKLTERQVPLTGVSVILRERYGRNLYTNKSNDSGIVHFTSIKRGWYQVLGTVRNVTLYKTFFLSEDTHIPLHFDHRVTIHAFNSTTQTTLMSFSCVTYRLDGDNRTIVFSNQVTNGTVSFDVFPGVYEILISASGFQKLWNGSIAKDVTLSLWLGYYFTTLSIVNFQGTPIIDDTFVILNHEDTNIWKGQMSNNDLLPFPLIASEEYKITASRDGISVIVYLCEDFNITTVIKLQSYIILEVLVVNGSELQRFPLVNAIVSIFDSTSLLASANTNENGTCSFYLDPVLNLNIICIAQYGEFSKNTSFLSNWFSRVTIPLGYARLIFSCQSFYGLPIEDVQLTIFNGSDLSQEITQVITTEFGNASVLVPVGNYSIHLVSNTWTQERDITLTQSGVYFSGFTLNIKINCTILLRDRVERPLKDAIVSISPTIFPDMGLDRSTVTDSEGVAKFSNIPVGVYDLLVSYKSYCFPLKLEVTSSESRYRLVFNFDTRIWGNSLGNKWPGIRQYQVYGSKEYADQYVQSTLASITITLVSFVVIITVLSLLSIVSVVTFPIVQNRRNLLTFKVLGATNEQISFAVAVQFVIYAIIASIIGIIVGSTVVIGLQDVGTANLGGIIISPKFDTMLSLVILLSVVVVVFINAYTQTLMICQEFQGSRSAHRNIRIAWRYLRQRFTF